MNRPLYALAVAMAGPALLLVAAGCGDEGEMTPADYLRGVNGILDSTGHAMAAVEEPFSGKVAAGAAAEASRTYFERSAAVLKDAREGLGGLAPPSEAKAAHQSMIAAIGALEEVTADFEARSAGIASAAEMEAMANELFGDERLSSASEQFGQACAALQELADSNGTGLDLACEGGVASWPAGEPLTAKRYFQRLQAVFEKAKASTDDIARRLDSDLDSAQTLTRRKAAVRRFLADSVEVFEETLREMRELSPPPGARRAHRGFLASAAALIEAAKVYGVRVASAQTEADAGGIVAEFGASTRDLIRRGDRACYDLQSAADESKTGLDLNCEG